MMTYGKPWICEGQLWVTLWIWVLSSAWGRRQRMAVKISSIMFTDTQAIQSTQVASQYLPWLPVYITTSNWGKFRPMS